MTPERLREIAQIMVEARFPHAVEYQWFGKFDAGDRKSLGSQVWAAIEGAHDYARAIAPLIEAARAEGQKDMQERCVALADADMSALNEKSIAHKASGDLETMYRINAAWHSVRSLSVAIAALPIDGANQIQSSDGGAEGSAPVEEDRTATATGSAIKQRAQQRAEAGIKPGPSEAKQGAEPVAWCVFWNEGNSACRRTFDTETPALSWAAYLDRERCTNVSVEPLWALAA